MQHHHFDQQSLIGTVLGFISVIYADVMGWMHVVSLSITVDLNLMQYAKLVMAPFIGATVGYFTPKFWNWVIKKLKPNNKNVRQGKS